MVTVTNPPTPSGEALVELRLAALERQAADLAARLDQADQDKLALDGRLHFTAANLAVAINMIAGLARAAGDQETEAGSRTIMDMTAAMGMTGDVAATRDTSLRPRRLRVVRSEP